MDLTDIQSLISTLGFPILMCLLQFFVNFSLLKNINTSISEIKEMFIGLLGGSKK